MSAMVSQITDISIVYSTVCLGENQRKRQSSASYIELDLNFFNTMVFIFSMSLISLLLFKM